MKAMSLALIAGCSAALATTPEPPAGDDVARLRAAGPPALDALLDRYDHLAPGAERDQLATTIDAVAAQRYATVSRLYWYTDLDAAETAARARHVPILSLRMLGDLREDLSCANSRLFRATLYANAEVGAFLRDHFVLHWSTERPVPRVTIDFGDGRKLVRTTTGNSAHYVLDEDGHVLDVLPGLYAPSAFRTELAASLQLAGKVRGLSDGKRAAAVVAFHQAKLTAASDAWGKLAGAIVMPTLRRLMRPDDVDSALAAAQRAAMSKARVEVPDLKRLGASPGALADGDLAAWATAGQILYGIGDLPSTANVAELSDGTPVRWGKAPQRAAKPAQPLFDARSRGLIEQLASVPARTLTPAQLADMIARLEQSAVADTAQNQLRLRPMIAAHIIETGGRENLADLNAWIYASVFHTPKDDAWLGLVSATDFSGLPGDGIVTP